MYQGDEVERIRTYERAKREAQDVDGQANAGDLWYNVKHSFDLRLPRGLQVTKQLKYWFVELSGMSSRRKTSQKHWHQAISSEV